MEPAKNKRIPECLKAIRKKISNFLNDFCSLNEFIITLSFLPMYINFYKITCNTYKRF